MFRRLNLAFRLTMLDEKLLPDEASVLYDELIPVRYSSFFRQIDIYLTNLDRVMLRPPTKYN